MSNPCSDCSWKFVLLLLTIFNLVNTSSRGNLMVFAHRSGFKRERLLYSAWRILARVSSWPTRENNIRVSSVPESYYSIVLNIEEFPLWNTSALWQVIWWKMLTVNISLYLWENGQQKLDLDLKENQTLSFYIWPVLCALKRQGALLVSNRIGQLNLLGKWYKTVTELSFRTIIRFVSF